MFRSFLQPIIVLLIAVFLQACAMGAADSLSLEAPKSTDSQPGSQKGIPDDTGQPNSLFSEVMSSQHDASTSADQEPPGKSAPPADDGNTRNKNGSDPEQKKNERDEQGSTDNESKSPQLGATNGAYNKTNCKLPVIPGPCKGDEKRYAWVSKLGRCVEFSYSGCEGNQNNFKTKQECENACK